ncbi:dTDP-4-dehydrorhamnose 3,5-epimerase family protein [Nocardiopsis alborubida]|uniref:dTDP-4-keto-6-deoxy-D-glucose epimerase n=1 Tax=Nocardiopsis alborubida TaxID=146802 RepID=A0A7X6RT51_9ACTN|nr:dTDP-4-dehydrorhamnose 3,5-epimerase [Nocardiopsis alborubida]NKZ01364.1 dTDP-4-keto-6-deoxy-D-glucose epimerase [Nocardiopsis alborubida]
MQVNPLSVTGAYEFVPDLFPDRRGFFAAPYQEQAFTRAVGRPLFGVAQSGHSRSRKGVARGIHFTSAPPGMATYVHCARGRVQDFAVDLRVGSPTFGRWDTRVLDSERCNAVYLPTGMGHAFLALEEESTVCYLLSEGYVPENEHAISLFDDAIGLPVPADTEVVLSDRDRSAVSLASALSAGLLPSYAACLRLEESSAP